MSANGYAGDLLPKEAWTFLEQHEDAVLVDVRTKPEWEFVGVSDLSSLGREPLFVEWQIYGVGGNSNFVEQVASAGMAKDTPILLLCRSGVRSQHGAIALTQAGFQNCYNINDGFEGQLDHHRHRGAEGTGWKACGLPWSQ